MQDEDWGDLPVEEAGALDLGLAAGCAPAPES